MNPQDLKKSLCKTFCDDIAIREVESGIVVSARYSDEVGDPIECYIEKTELGTWTISDDGQFIPDLIGKGLDITTKSRAEFLSRAMKISNAHYDAEYFTICTDELTSFPSPGQIIDFLTTLLRARDVSFWTKERIRSTFKEDAFLAISAELSNFTISRNSPVPNVASLRDFPADIVVSSDWRDGIELSVAIFLVQESSSITEALTLWLAAAAEGIELPTFALIENAARINMNSTKVQRAINRIDTFAIWDDDKKTAVEKIVKNVRKELT
ncbi:DUF1828 domain-containing protein [Acetobacter ascendens]|uniref:DUF1828 domain-containing protein n=1 Tax=Acetobacter ascendens TaxID=481146 RepID=UPI000875C4F0|nr:DUF1828 domain-containing protein [Acetobacter ascendens]AOW48401.1 hypothetical protein A4R89_02110 [Acetobacter ascendens]